MARSSKLKRAVVTAAIAVSTVAIASGTWALNRFVVDHVEISDVRAYEAQASAASTATTSTDSPTAAETVSAAASAASPATTPTVSKSASATPATKSAPAPATATASASASSKAASTPASTPSITANSYKSDRVSITISRVVKGSGNSIVTYYVADIVVADASLVRSAFANNEFGTNIVDLPSTIAKQNGGIFAINGDYYGFRDSGIVIRNGVIFRDKGARNGLAFYKDGTVQVYDETKTTAKKLLADGVWNTMSFGPALLVDGAIPAGIESFEVDTNFGNHSIQGRQPRTAVGLISARHYVFVAVDGRAQGYSVGVTMTEMAQIMQDLGCTVAYNIDGGGSTTMYFNGTLVNRPSNNGERATSDIFYVAG